MKDALAQAGGVKDFELTFRLRNNQLRARRLRAGLTAEQFCEMTGVTQSMYSAYENLRLSPMGKRGWRVSALSIARYWKMKPAELWPDAVLAVVDPVQTVEMHGSEVAALVTGRRPERPDELLEQQEFGVEIRRVLATLTPRQRHVIEQRYFEGKSCEELGQDMSVTQTRIRQIEAKAMRELRKPKRADLLASYLPSLEFSK